MTTVRAIGIRLLGLAALALAPLASAAPVEVRDLRLWAGPDSTRVVLDLSGPADHTLFALPNPERVVVDIEAGSFDPAALRIPEGQGYARALRMAEREGGELRLVIDLGQKVKAKSFITPPNEAYGYRLVIDLATDEPPKAIKDHFHHLGARTQYIGVFDPQDELPSVMPGEEPVVQGRTGRPDMKIPRRGGGYADSDFGHRADERSVGR